MFYGISEIEENVLLIWHNKLIQLFDILYDSKRKQRIDILLFSHIEESLDLIMIFYTISIKFMRLISISICNVSQINQIL